MKKASVYLLLICLLSSCSLKYNYEVDTYDVDEWCVDIDECERIDD